MDKKVYGIEAGCGFNADDIRDMTDAAKKELVEKSNTDEVYTLEAWFNYLNADMIDTENYYWVVI